MVLEITVKTLEAVGLAASAALQASGNTPSISTARPDLKTLASGLLDHPQGNNLPL